MMRSLSEFAGMNHASSNAVHGGEPALLEVHPVAAGLAHHGSTQACLEEPGVLLGEGVELIGHFAGDALDGVDGIVDQAAVVGPEGLLVVEIIGADVGVCLLNFSHKSVLPY
jgi:hypothetical protein